MSLQATNQLGEKNIEQYCKKLPNKAKQTWRGHNQNLESVNHRNTKEFAKVPEDAAQLVQAYRGETASSAQ